MPGISQVELIVRLDRHEAHVLALHGLSDRLGIEIIVLVRLYERLYELRRDQPSVVALLGDSAAQEVRSRTGFHANQSWFKVRRECQQLLA